MGKTRKDGAPGTVRYRILVTWSDGVTEGSFSATVHRPGPELLEKLLNSDKKPRKKRRRRQKKTHF